MRAAALPQTTAAAAASRCATTFCLHGPTVLPLATIAATRVDPAATAQVNSMTFGGEVHRPACLAGDVYYLDAKGLSCQSWYGYDCKSEAPARYGYTADEAANLTASCPQCCSSFSYGRR